jgi:RNA polymerase sigma factor (sigma-70 family)
MASTEELNQTIRQVLLEHRGRFFSFVKKRARSLDPEDIVQLASERALMKSAQLQDPDKAEAWVMRIVRNTLIDELRKKQPISIELEEQHTIEEESHSAPCWCILSQSTQIKPEYREILRKVDIEETPVHIAAQELGLSANNAMVRLHRARKALQKQMQEHCGTTTARSCMDCGCEERGCCPPPWIFFINKWFQLLRTKPHIEKGQWDIGFSMWDFPKGQWGIEKGMW